MVIHERLALKRDDERCAKTTAQGRGIDAVDPEALHMQNVWPKATQRARHLAESLRSGKRPSQGDTERSTRCVKDEPTHSKAVHFFDGVEPIAG
jgi:hypothetical protein